MKKFLISLLWICFFSIPTLFAQPTLSGNLGYFATIDKNINDHISRFGSLSVQLESQIDSYNHLTLALSSASSSDLQAVIEQASFSTDLSAYFGIEKISLSTLLGKFSDWFTHGHRATTSGREIPLDRYWSLGASNSGEAEIQLGYNQQIGARAYLNLGSGTNKIHGYKLGLETLQPQWGIDMMISYTSVDGAIEGDTDFDGQADSTFYNAVGFLKADGGYRFNQPGFDLYIPFGILYDRENSQLHLGTGASYVYEFIGINLGGRAVLNDGNPLKILDAEVMITPVEWGQLYYRLYSNPSSDRFFKSIDAGARLTIGKARFYGGGVYGFKNSYVTNVCESTKWTGPVYSVFGSGIYLAGKLHY